MGKIFHEGADTQEQDYAYSWTPSTTNVNTGIYEAPSGPPAMYNGTIASPSWYAFDVEDEVCALRPPGQRFAVLSLENVEDVYLPGRTLMPAHDHAVVE